MVLMDCMRPGESDPLAEFRPAIHRPDETKAAPIDEVAERHAAVLQNLLERTSAAAAGQHAEGRDGADFFSDSRMAMATEDPHTAISVLETDYDASPTGLYALIEKRQWADALTLLTNLEHYAALTQASTWVIRREEGGGTTIAAETSGQRKVRWRLLPLHAALIFRGPLGIVEALLRAYPGAARCRDDQGMTPAHLAFRNDAADEILDAVLAAYPPAVAVQDRKGRDALACALDSAACTKKGRARLLATYAAAVRAGERDGVLAEASARHEAEMASLKEQYEARLAREGGDGAEREAVLTQKVQDLTLALQDMTAIRQDEAQRHGEEAGRWSAVSRDVLHTLGEGPSNSNGSNGEVVGKDDVLRSSVDELVTSHRRLQAERDSLAERNDVLEDLLVRVVAERDDVQDILSRLDQDLAAAQTVRERMVAAISRQETDVYGSVAREHGTVRGILERQRDEMEATLRAGDGGNGSAGDERGTRHSDHHHRRSNSSAMSELGLGGAEEGRLPLPPRPPPSRGRSKSPCNRRAAAGY